MVETGLFSGVKLHCAIVQLVTAQLNLTNKNKDSNCRVDVANLPKSAYLRNIVDQ